MNDHQARKFTMSIEMQPIGGMYRWLSYIVFINLRDASYQSESLQIWNLETCSLVFKQDLLIENLDSTTRSSNCCLWWGQHLMDCKKIIRHLYVLIFVKVWRKVRCVCNRWYLGSFWSSTGARAIEDARIRPLKADSKISMANQIPNLIV